MPAMRSLMPASESATGMLPILGPRGGEARRIHRCLIRTVPS